MLVYLRCHPLEATYIMHCNFILILNIGKHVIHDKLPCTPGPIGLLPPMGFEPFHFLFDIFRNCRDKVSEWKGYLEHQSSCNNPSIPFLLALDGILYLLMTWFLSIDVKINETSKPLNFSRQKIISIFTTVYQLQMNQQWENTLMLKAEVLNGKWLSLENACVQIRQTGIDLLINS